MRPLLVALAIRSLAALGVIGLLAPALSPASAADYDLPTLRGSEINFIPAFPRYLNWEGFYAGGQVTYSSSSVDFTTATQPLVVQALQFSTILANMTPQYWQPLTTRDTSAGGFGGFAGYNFQWDSAVIGLELSYMHTSLDAASPNTPIERVQTFGGVINDVTLTATGDVHIRDVVTTRARFGWVINNFLPYATVGLAFGRADLATSVNIDVKEFDPNTKLLVGEFTFALPRVKPSAYLYGYSAGGGLEFALTNNIFARAEYEFIQWQRFWAINAVMQNFRAGVGVKF
jgi:opacity protein-like surface antigen